MAGIEFDIQYTDPRDRVSSGLRLLWAVPHLIIVNVLASVRNVLSLVQWFIILFTGKRNQGLWNLTSGILNWQGRAWTYAGLMYDTYPEFALEGKNEPVSYAATFEEPADRLTNGLRLIWALPALVISIALSIAGVFVTIACWFAILSTGTQPRGMFDFLVKVHRYVVRTNAYLALLTDTYPKYE